MNKTILFSVLPAVSLFGSVQHGNGKEKKPLNIVFIAVDDMNNWVGALGGQAKTPNIDKMAKNGVLFTNAFCVVPACNPSRTALMTGLRPEKTGQYENEGNFRDVPGNDKLITLAQKLQSFGYETVAAGKIFHHPRGAAPNEAPLSDPISWNAQWKGTIGTKGDELYINADGWAKWHNGELQKVNPNPQSKGGLTYIGHSGIWGPIPQTTEECGDWKMADFCADFLKQDHNKPFFLACGIFRPHSPQLAPQKYFDMYPLESIVLPEVPDNDMDDIPEIAKENWSSPFVKMMRDKGQWKNAVQGYLACMTFADDCIGHIYDALKESKYANNTVLVFWTDHGWQLGTKNRWEKFSLWHQATNAPLIISYPNMKSAGSRCTRAISFLDLYPTVLDLLDQPIPAGLDGHSIKKLIDNPNKKWKYPAVITYPEGSYSVEFEQWNYIRYIDGSEELYDHSKDPKEFKNLASDPKFAGIILNLKRFIPKNGIKGINH